MPTNTAFRERSRPHPSLAATRLRARDRDAPEAIDGPVRWKAMSGLVPAFAIATFLMLIAVAVLRPGATQLWLPLAAAILAVTGWWAARSEAEVRRVSYDDLKTENRRLAAELEKLSDTAWELRESEERYRNLIDAQGDLVVRRDADGGVTFMNPAFADAFGLDPAEALGQPLAFGPARETMNPDATAEDVRIAGAGGPRWYAWIDIPVRDDQGRLGPWYSVARDITARKESEQALVEARRKAEAASRAKSQLLATVSHEFRTPLNGILGLTGLLRESGLTNDQETYARGVQSSGEALLALVDDMLDFSRIEAGRLDIRPEPTAPGPLVQDIVELLAERAHGKGIDIAADVDPATPMVAVDPVRLRQVLINLVGNGVKFTETGGVTVSVAVLGGDADGDRDGAVRLGFAVADTGPGVARDEAERLFGEFEQSDRAPNRRHGGTGLGLAISRRIVERMGGTLTLGAQTGPGARFEFALTLPVAGPPQELPATRLAGRRILVLAGNGAEPAIVVRQLTEAGAEVRLVDNLKAAGGLVAAALAARHGYHAALIDHRLAGSSAAALAELRDAAGDRLPAAVLIEPGRRSEIPALREAGFDAYLVRPLRRASLLRVMDEIAEAPVAFIDDPCDAEAPPPPPAPARAAALDVLLAEDNEINALLARAVLERLGHAVTEVRDGAAALAAVEARATPFDVILMDIHMPELDGLSAVAGIRTLERTLGIAPTPVLALTADVLPETREAAEKAGVTGLLPKPITPEALRNALGDLAAA